MQLKQRSICCQLTYQHLIVLDTSSRKIFIVFNTIMKDDKDPASTEGDLKKQQEMLIRNRILNHQLNKIKNMSMQQLLEKTRNREPVLPPSITDRHIRQKQMEEIRNAGMHDNVEEIVDKQMDLYREAQINRKLQLQEMRQAPVMSQIKRGKLGMDNLLIGFAIFGSFLLPYIFYRRFKSNRERIINSRKYPPEVIALIDDDSPIDLDSVSEQTIHYDNPHRRQQTEKRREELNKITELKRQLDL